MASLRNTISYYLAKIPWYRRMSVCRHYGPKFKDYYRSTRQQEWFSPEQMKEYQNRHFLKIVRHAFDNVPFYRDFYAQAGLRKEMIRSIDDIEKLPCIDKETVRTNGNLFKAEDFERYRPVSQRTSGSTGKPLELFVDGDMAQLGEAMLWRHFNWAGYRFHDKAAYLEFPLGFKEGKIDTETLFTMDASRKVVNFNSGMLNPQTLPKICAKLEKFRPDTFHSYPSLLIMLAEYLRNHPEFTIRPHSIIARSEKLYPEQRQAIEEAFGCKVFEIYAQWEYLCFATDCPSGRKHHFFDLGIVNIVKDGHPCPDGEVGELICTGLHNYSMPLIRYKLGDIGKIAPSDCSCGRRMPILEIVGCRGKDLIVTSNG